MNFFSASYDISARCDYRCIYCRNDWNDPQNNMDADFNDVKRILSGFKEKGFKRVIFTGGEFFVFPHWREALDYSTHLGLGNWIISNAYYAFQPEDVDYLKKHVSRINISFHAPNHALYYKIMCPPHKNAFDRVVGNMQMLSDAGLELGLFFSPIKQNYHLLFETVAILKKKGIKLTDVNVNRIVNTQSASNFLDQGGRLNLFEHASLVRQVAKVSTELCVPIYLESYPQCFINSLYPPIDNAAKYVRPCIMGRKALSFNMDGSSKLCPATHFAISDADLNSFTEGKWRNKTCLACPQLDSCLGGCHAASGKPFDDDPLMIDDVQLEKGIDKIFFDLLIKLYNPFLGTSFKKDPIQYTIFNKSKYPHPIGLVALKRTKSGGCFFELALIPQVRGTSAAFLSINKFLSLHPEKKIDWTAHKANLPSIRLLQKLNGGFFEKTVQNKRRIEAEGFFRPGSKVLKTMETSLLDMIPESETKYREWLVTYKSRKQERANLDKFLEEYGQ